MDAGSNDPALSLKPLALIPVSSSPPRFDLVRHAPELIREAAWKSELGVANRSDEPARLVQRQRGDIAAEVQPDPIHHQVLFDVRQVERLDDRVVRADVRAHRPNG